MPASWEITVDGVPRSYRDRKEMAIQGAEYLTARNPGAVVVVRNVDSDTPIAVEALMQWLRTVAGSVKSQLWAANSQRRSLSR